MPTKSDWIVWTSELSPFGLKVIRLLRQANYPFVTLPDPAHRRWSWSAARRKKQLVEGKLPLTWPKKSAQDEFPLVPFVLGPEGENLYDSSAIAEWLDRQSGAEEKCAFLPKDSAAHFLVRLIDEYADEIGLYFAHHYRWKVSALNNTAGHRLSAEMAALLGPFSKLLGPLFSMRQARRLPYLFSCAPAGYKQPGLPGRLQAPHCKGFPATHDFLEDGFCRLLDCLERLLDQRPYILGEQITLADISLYGQLGMSLSDPDACDLIRARAPVLYRWLLRMASEKRLPDAKNADWQLDDALSPLLSEICRSFVPLMQQNMAAYQRHKLAGETLFNEAAFNKRKALYDGEIDGTPFRSVAKSFQAGVWEDLQSEWSNLDSESKALLERLLPYDHGIDQGIDNVE